MEKYIIFAVPTEKEVNKNVGVTKNISYMLQFIDSVRLMASSLSNFVNNLSEGTRKLNVNTYTMIENVKPAK